MAVNLTRNCVSTSKFARLFRVSLPEISCVPSSGCRHTGQCRNLHTSDQAYGGRPKSEWRRKRAPALTRLTPDKPERFKTRKAFGGGEKTKVTRAKVGTYIWKSQDIQFQTPILDVLYNTAHKDFTERNIMVRGTVVEVDGEQFKTWYENVSGIDDTNESKSQAQVNVDERILQQIQNGKVLARVSSRPGQEGKVNGYLLEGDELDAYFEQTRNRHGGNM